ncbi:MAG: hypothetical protein R2745_04075 [Vicinamibacterales bacterium]
MPRLTASLPFLVLSLAVVSAAGPDVWRVATQPDFLKGDLDQVSVDEHGRLTLGPAIATVFEGDVPIVWTGVARAGGPTYLGTGNDGKVLRVDADGKGGVFFDAAELEVHALALAPDGGLFVGTSPDGRVYKVNAAGVATPYFDPEEKYIWALALDARGDLFVATGDPKGRVYRVSPQGTGTPFYTSGATHVVSMAFDAERRLVVGTESPGRVFRLDAEGRPFLLLDTDMQEVRALRSDARGRMFVVAQAGRSGGGDTGGGAETPTPAPAAPRAPVPTVTVSITSMSVAEPQPSATAASSPSEGGAVTGAIFRIDPDGMTERIWEARDDTPFDVAPLEDGALLVATGHRGKLYRLEGDPLKATLLGRVPARQAVQFVAAGGRMLVATSNSGALVRVGTAHAERGTYTSDVKDAKTTARWGTIAWRATTPAGTRVEVATRSGNTATPDEGWSPWSAAYTEADGAAVTSPVARYLQWRVTLSGKGATPVVTSVSAAYLQRNQRPVVSSLVLHPPGVVFQKPFSTGETEIAGYQAEAAERRLSNQGQPPPSTATATLGRRTYQQGLQTVVWKGDDENGDDLEYSVSFRREGDTAWTTLVEGLTDPIYVWDTTSVPSGSYVVKVTASDAPSEPADRALRGEAESSVLQVDSVAPVVSIRPPTRSGARLDVIVDARDDHSAIEKVEYSLAGGPWQAAYPADGLLDSRKETVTLSFPADVEGQSVVVRATDALHNVGVADVRLTP